MPCDNSGRDQSVAAANQGQRFANKDYKLTKTTKEGERQERILPYRFQREHDTIDTRADFELLASRSVRQYILVGLSHTACGTFL